jgi:hypothetical protein
MSKTKTKPNARNVLTRLRLNGGQLATEAAEVIEMLIKRLNDANAIIHRRGANHGNSELPNRLGAEGLRRKVVDKLDEDWLAVELEASRAEVEQWSDGLKESFASLKAQSSAEE